MNKIRKYYENIYTGTREDYINNLEKVLVNKEKKLIITVNSEIMMTGEIDKVMHKILIDPNIDLIPDGIGVVKKSKKYNKNIKNRLPGIELTSTLFEFCDKHKKSIYLFGSTPEVLNKLREKIKKEYPNADVVGTSNGYITAKNKEFNKIAKLKPDVVMVALGVPIQEKLIYNNLHKFKKGIFIGVGGSFDVLSGSKKRAPMFMRKANLEWLYRIVSEPKRIKKFIKYNLVFFLRR